MRRTTVACIVTELVNVPSVQIIRELKIISVLISDSRMTAASSANKFVPLPTKILFAVYLKINVFVELRFIDTKMNVRKLLIQFAAVQPNVAEKWNVTKIDVSVILINTKTLQLTISAELLNIVAAMVSHKFK